MEEYVFTPQDYLNILKRRKKAILLPFFSILVIALVTAWLLPAVFKSSATVMIEQREIPAEYVMSSQTTYAEQRMQNIKQRTLTSRQLQQLIRQFGLYGEEREQMTTDEILMRMREEISLEPVHVEVADKRSGRTATATIAFTLSYEGKNPRKIQQVTDQIVTLFLKEDLKERTDQASSTHDFLRREKEKIRLELASTEEILAEFKKQNANALPEMFQFNMQTLNTVERNREMAKEELKNLKEKKEELEEQLANTVVDLEANLLAGRKDEDEQRLELLKMELINLKTQYSEFYPDVKKLQQEIYSLGKAVEARKRQADIASVTETSNGNSTRNPAYITLSSRLAGLKSDIRSVEARIGELNHGAEEYQKRLAAAPDVEGRYNEILTERNNLNAKYKEMQAKMMEAKEAHALEAQQKGERFTLIESATLPEKPFKPNRLAIILIGFVLAFGAGIGMAAVMEFVDDSIRDPDSLERLSGFPVLTTIPRITTQEEVVKNKKMRIIWTTGILVLGLVAVWGFDAFVMDLDVLWAKVMRKLS